MEITDVILDLAIPTLDFLLVPVSSSWKLCQFLWEISNVAICRIGGQHICANNTKVVIELYKTSVKQNYCCDIS